MLEETGYYTYQKRCSMLEEYYVPLEKEKKNTGDLSKGRFTLFKGRNKGVGFSNSGGVGHSHTNRRNSPGHHDSQSEPAHRPESPLPAGDIYRQYTGNPLQKNLFY